MAGHSHASRATTMGGVNKPQKVMQPESEEEDFDDNMGDESDDGDFPRFDKMPAQHPATRTTAQLMGT